MIKRKKILSKVLATTMIASTFTVSASALEPRAAVSSSSLAGNDRYQTAVKVSESGWTSATNAVIINGDRGLVDALTATPYASLKNAPILITGKDKLNSDTKARLTKLGVKNVDIVGGEAVVSKAVEDELKAMGLTVKRIKGDDRYKTAVKVAEEIHKISSVSKVAVVNGDTGLPDAVSVAAPAADNKMPILLSDPKQGITKESKDFLNGKSISKSYVIGQTNAVSESVMNSLPGSKTRLGGTDRHDTNAKVVKEFYTSKSLDNIYVAKSGYVKNNEELVDALAVGVLAAKNDDPVVIVGKTLGDTQKTLLREKSFTKITQVGNGIPQASIDGIKDTQKDPEAKVTGVTLVDYKTVKLTGSELNRISASNISMSGNSVYSYSANSTGSEATVVFNNAFNGTNTITVKSNLGTSTNHTFTYGSEIKSVESTTKEIATSGVQYLGFTVNGGQKRTVEELKSLGWTIEFKSSKDVFYNDNNPATPLKTSKTGKLKTTGFTKNDIFDYEITLTKGSTVIKTTDKKVVTVSDTANDIASIKSHSMKFIVGSAKDNSFVSNKLLTGEKVEITSVKGVQNNGTEKEIKGEVTVRSSDDAVLKVEGNVITARKAGNATLTISKGSLERTVNIQVLNAVNNDRVVNNAKYYQDGTQKTSVKLTKDGNVMTLKVKTQDQYGDPINSDEVELEKNEIFTSNNSQSPIAAINLKQFANGEAELTLTPKSQAGSGYVKIKRRTGGTLKDLGSLSVSVSEATTRETYSLDVVPPKDATAEQKDLSLDRYDYKNDDELTLKVNAFDSNGNLKGGVDIGGDNYIIKGYDADLLSVTKDPSDDSQIIVAPKSGKTKTGSTTVSLYEKDGSRETLMKSVSIKIVNTTPVIERISMKTVSDITSINATTPEFNILDLFNISYSNIGGSGDINNEKVYKKVVEGVTVKGYANQEVLMSIEHGNEGGGHAILFIDRGATLNGTYDEGDFILATLKIDLSTVTTATGDIVNGTVKLSSDTKDGSIIVGLYDGKYNATSSPRDTVIKVRIPR